jgi:putative spermidine/putrescine transport system substrate-binding protein
MGDAPRMVAAMTPGHDPGPHRDTVRRITLGKDNMRSRFHGLKLNLLAGFGALLLAGLAQPAAAQDKGSVTVSSYGGRYQDGLRKVVFQPFQAESGIVVKEAEASGNAAPTVKAMVMAGNVDIDVIQVSGSEYLLLSKQEFLEKIDASKLDQTAIGQYEPSGIQTYGVAYFRSASVIAYSTKKYSRENHPRTMEEFWDVKKFPGQRIVPAGNYVVHPNEFALMADGVAPDKLYPLDLDRSYDSLDKIRPYSRFVNSAAIAPQALIDGEADLAIATQGRIIELRDHGAPIDLEWNEGTTGPTYLVIPKGSKHVAEALKYISFAMQAKVQAEFARLLPYGPTNQDAFKYLSPAEVANLPSAPENRAKLVELHDDWWAATDASGKTNTEKNIAKWTAWTTQR